MFTHVPAEQVADGGEDAGLEDEGHHCNHQPMPELHVSVAKGQGLELEVAEIQLQLQTRPCPQPETAIGCCCVSQGWSLCFSGR